MRREKASQPRAGQVAVLHRDTYLRGPFYLPRDQTAPAAPVVTAAPAKTAKGRVAPWRVLWRPFVMSRPSVALVAGAARTENK